MKNESLLPPAFCSLLHRLGRFASSIFIGGRPARFNLSTYNLSGVAGSVGVSARKGSAFQRDFTIRYEMLKVPEFGFGSVDFSIGSLFICQDC